MARRNEGACVIRFGCRKFWRLSHQTRDRVLKPREEAFLAAHRDRCKVCAEEEQHGHIALDLLAESRLEPAMSSGFDARTIRRWRLARAKSSAAYWSPAVIGASVAALAVLAILQIITHSSEMPTLKPTAEQGRNELTAPLLPDLKISRASSVLR